ncbi:hypothetical protein Lal_00022164 [Lupinus albus]|uniref:Putative RNA recognition motif domain-containing protein n=1 Tax=Lupinus albus TaxID=3870 RepID=A0A6A5N290_LUPAL|nr:putative RNA recognition motif domain-containing protein [Lupinus albus]KAF1880037.1 hypothetical protein Lal_00022164 [Lupinus albus]
MSTSAASLALPFLSLRTLKHQQHLCFSSLSLFNPNSNPISISATFLRSYAAQRPTLSSSRFVSNVSLSEFDQEEDTFSEGDDEPSYNNNNNNSNELKLFVGNLPFGVDSARLAEIFEGAGDVERVEVIYDKMTGRSRGFGFVTMSSAEEVEAAVQQFNGYEVDGRELRVNSGPPPPRDENSRYGNSRFDGNSRFGRSPPRGGDSAADNGNRVHVGNLSWGVDEGALEELFGEHGRVLEAKVIYDRETGRSRGFGFVTYSSPEEVNKAVQSLDGVDLNGRAIRVSLADAKPPRRQF